MVRCSPNKEGPGAQGPGAHMGPGPRPIWALAHGPIWAPAHMGLGPYGLWPRWAGLYWGGPASLWLVGTSGNPAAQYDEIPLPL